MSYKSINGLQFYYEIYGDGFPLVLIHGGGSTISSAFGRVIPLFAKNRQVIAVELQAHGHTPDRDKPSSFEQDADDVAELLKQLEINSADIFGWSNGANTAMRIATRHSSLVRKLVAASAVYKRSGISEQFWERMKTATIDMMPAALKKAYLDINPSNEGLQAMFERDRSRMANFEDWPDDDIRAIKAPTLLISSDQDVMSPEHALEIYRLLPDGRLLIYPGVHGDFIGEICAGEGLMSPEVTVKLIERFLDQ